MIHAFQPNSLSQPSRARSSIQEHDQSDGGAMMEQSGRNRQLQSLRQRASTLLNVEHTFSGRIENDDGDRFEFHSELSFSMEFRQEMELLSHQNRHALRKRALESFPWADEEGNGTQLKGLEQSGDNAEQKLDEIVPEYATSGATADRIVDFAKGMLPFFLGAEEGRTLNEDTLEEFDALMRGSFETGFEQAKSIIGDMDLMNDPLGNLIQTTYNKVQAKFDEFLETTRAQFKGRTTGEDSSEENRQEIDGDRTVTQFDSQFRFESTRSAETHFDETG